MPYQIRRRVGPVSYEVALADDQPAVGVYHSSALTPFRGSNVEDPPMPVNPIRKRGRPRKNPSLPLPADGNVVYLAEEERGRPRKHPATPELVAGTATSSEGELVAGRRRSP